MHDVLVRHHAPCSPAAYLNGGPTLAGFRTLTGRGNFLLARMPAPLQALVVAEVERQAVRHDVLVGHDPPVSGVFVRLGRGSFTCLDAWAEWSEDGAFRSDD